MDKLSILILNSSVIYGGGEFFTFRLALNLKKNGHIVYIGCRKDTLLYQKCRDEEINVYHLDFPNKGAGELGKNISAIKKIIKKHDIRIVHSNTNYDRTAGAFAAIGTKAKHITSCHSLESIQHNVTHYIRNKFLTRHFIADGNSIMDLITKENNISGEKISVIHNGINPDGMKRNLELRNAVRNEFGIHDDEILIGNLGRLVPFKGHKYLLLAFKVIYDNFKNVKLMIAGDGELHNSLKDYAGVMGISDSVIFAGFREDLQAVYSAFDIYCNCSTEGGGELFPFSVLYAMAQGIAVVAAKAGDIHQMVKDGINGYLVTEKSPYQISEKLMILINNREIRTKMGGAGLKMLARNFTEAQMIRQIEEVYKMAIK
ncbi:MAG: glycosyltransferase family 4 protein [Chlorobi bacterium]|nr:glycosyltransferase family 4 protein [Chlorobiota bacterium]